jgi:hypothetical protein
VPRDIAAAAEPVLRLVQIDAEAAMSCVSARAVRVIENERIGGLGRELRALLELIVVVIARSAGQCQYLRYQINIDGCEECRLPVATHNVFSKSGVGVQTQAGIVRIGAGNGSDRRQAIRAAGCRDGKVRRVTLWDEQVVEILLVEDLEVFPKSADETAYAVVLGGAQADLVALMGIA